MDFAKPFNPRSAVAMPINILPQGVIARFSLLTGDSECTIYGIHKAYNPYKIFCDHTK
jgi:hypothetical protein